jgi:hypothetical protein
MLDTFFPFVQAFDTEEIYFDRVQRARRLAPYVVSTIEGKPMPNRGYTTYSFRPPYVKPKHVVEPSRTQRRLVGERLLGSLTLKQRMDRAVLDNLAQEDMDITRREEWQALQLLRTGAMVCQSVDHPPVTVDLQRNPAHTVVLTGSLAWGQSGVDALGNLQDWASLVQRNSGYHPSTVIMDPLAGRRFLRSPGVLTVMQSFRQLVGDVNLAGVVTGGAPGQELKFLGSIGEFDVYQYQQLYQADDGSIQQFMPDNTVIMGNRQGFEGTRCYGAVKDADAGLLPLPRFPKAWKQEDPSAWMTLTQSSPLPLAGVIDASFCATVSA